MKWWGKEQQEGKSEKEPVKADKRQKKDMKKSLRTIFLPYTLPLLQFQLNYILRSIPCLKKSQKRGKTGKNLISDWMGEKRAEKWREGRWEKGLRGIGRGIPTYYSEDK